MDIITADIESFWSPTYSLSKMSPLEYVLGDEFETISCSIKVNGYPTDVFFGHDDVAHAFKSIKGRIENSLLIAHNNSGFDSYVFSYVFGLKPRMWGCTMAMARPLHAKTVGLSLAKLVQHYGLGVKNNAVLLQTRGKHLADFTPDELDAMKVYNREDTDQCYALFNKLRPHYTGAELWQIDALTRMRVEPKFQVDRQMLEVALSMERGQKQTSILRLAQHLRKSGMSSEKVSEATTVETLEEAVRTELASAPKFAALLESLGVPVPMKPSPSNPDKQVPALAKTDEAFTDLQQHENPVVAAAARARLAVKSTLLETRIEKFLTASKLAGGLLPVPLRYCGADTTGRDSGEEYNCQNLFRIGGTPKITDALRNSMKAPKGFKVIVADQSGIELRVNHFLWKVQSSMELYAANPEADLYKAFAAARYQKAPEDVTKPERQLAKMCLLEGTLVLTQRGEVPIEQVNASDKVWDGVEWVNTLGPIYKGVRHVIRHDQLTATPDHEVWVEDGRKIPFGSAAAQSLRLARTGSGGAPLGFGGTCIPGDNPNQGSQARTNSLCELRRGETDQLREPEKRRDSGLPELQSKVRSAAVAVGAHGVGEAEVHQPQRVELSPLRGTRHKVQLSYGRCSGSVGDGKPGAIEGDGCRSAQQRRPLRTGQPTLGDAQVEHGQPVAFQAVVLSQIPHGTPGGSIRGQHTEESFKSRADVSTDCRAVGTTVAQTEGRVWDLLNCGPRNRFTANGRLVSNCQLGLGFGAGWKTFLRVAKTMGGLDLTNEESEAITDAWRTEYAEITEGWKRCQAALRRIQAGSETAVDTWGMVTTCGEGLRLPSGRLIRYPDLRQEDGKWPDGRERKDWVYGHGRHKAHLHGGKVDENIVQALARDSIFDCAIDYYKSTRLRPALRVHDELVYVVPESEADALLAELQRIMRTPPKWWPELVVHSEGDSAASYGAAK